MKKILIIFGTRPEAIKMAPLVLEFQKYNDKFETKVCVTAQHREMLDQVLDIFEIKPDFDLDIMKKNQDLYDITEKIIHGLKGVLEQYSPDLVCVHGDTTTAFVGALSAFYKKIPVAHIEAGLRSKDIYSPWPEEANRKIISTLATLNLAPTQLSRENLLKENIDKTSIYVTGNTVIDALQWMMNKISNNKEYRNKIKNEIKLQYRNFSTDKKFVLITGHRRENFGEGFVQICKAISILAKNYPDVDFVYPVHLNPNVQKPVYELLDGLENIFLIKPMEYELFCYIMSKAYIVLTDSGGIQEEAPSLGKPVLVMRENTERPEALSSGTVKLVGTKSQNIIDEVSKLFDEPMLYKKMSRAINPYGDGSASKKIVDIINLTEFNN